MLAACCEALKAVEKGRAFSSMKERRNEYKIEVEDCE